MPEPLLSIGDAAERLGIPITTLRGWANRGIIPTVKMPTGHRRFRPSDVDRVVSEMGLAPDTIVTAAPQLKEGTNDAR